MVTFKLIQVLHVHWIDKLLLQFSSVFSFILLQYMSNKEYLVLAASRNNMISLRNITILVNADL